MKEKIIYIYIKIIKKQRNTKLFIKFSERKNRENWKKKNEYSTEKYCLSYPVNNIDSAQLRVGRITDAQNRSK